MKKAMRLALAPLALAAGLLMASCGDDHDVDWDTYATAVDSVANGCMKVSFSSGQKFQIKQEFDPTKSVSALSFDVWMEPSVADVGVSEVSAFIQGGGRDGWQWNSSANAKDSDAITASDSVSIGEAKWQHVEMRLMCAVDAHCVGLQLWANEPKGGSAVFYIDNFAINGSPVKFTSSSDASDFMVAEGDGSLKYTTEKNTAPLPSTLGGGGSSGSAGGDSESGGSSESGGEEQQPAGDGKVHKTITYTKNLAWEYQSQYGNFQTLVQDLFDNQALAKGDTVKIKLTATANRNIGTVKVNVVETSPAWKTLNDPADPQLFTSSTTSVEGEMSLTIGQAGTASTLQMYELLPTGVTGSDTLSLSNVNLVVEINGGDDWDKPAEVPDGYIKLSFKTTKRSGIVSPLLCCSEAKDTVVKSISCKMIVTGGNEFTTGKAFCVIDKSWAWKEGNGVTITAGSPANFNHTFESTDKNAFNGGIQIIANSTAGGDVYTVKISDFTLNGKKITAASKFSIINSSNQDDYITGMSSAVFVENPKTPAAPAGMLKAEFTESASGQTQRKPSVVYDLSSAPDGRKAVQVEMKLFVPTATWEAGVKKARAMAKVDSTSAPKESDLIALEKNKWMKVSYVIPTGERAAGLAQAGIEMFAPDSPVASGDADPLDGCVIFIDDFTVRYDDGTQDAFTFDSASEAAKFKVSSASGGSGTCALAD